MRKLLSIVLACTALVALAVPALASPAVKHARLDVYGFAFRPGTLTIKRGTKVVWTWVDGSGIAHNVAVKSGPAKFRSPTQGSGSYSHVFTKKGRYVLYCTLHPQIMREIVVVK